jgi:hypothetical protein
VPAGDVPAGDVPAGDVPAGDVPAGDVGAATLGILLRLKVVDFDLFFGFLSFVLHVLGFCFWVVCCFCCVSDTEQVLMPAFDILFWNQVI